MTHRDDIIEKFERRTLFSGTLYYWRIKAKNGEIILRSEGVKNRVDRDNLANNFAMSYDIKIRNEGT